MDAKAIAAGGLTAGLLLGAWGVLRDDRSPVPPTSEIGALTSTEPIDGIRPIEEVVTFWRQRVEMSPDGFLDRTQLGLALAAQARETADVAVFGESEAVLRDALSRNPADTATKLALAQALHSQHEFRAALRLAAEVVLAEPSSLGARALLGDTSLELGDLGAAEGHYSWLAERERSAPVVGRLARLAFATGDPDEAVRLAEEAQMRSAEVPLRPTDRAYYPFLLGHLRFQTGDVEGSIGALREALTIAPGSPAATELLAFVYASAGRWPEAERLYVELLATGPAADLHGAYADLLRAGGDASAADRQERFGRRLAARSINSPTERRHLATFFTGRDTSVAVDLARADLAERQDVGAFDTLAWALYDGGQIDEADDLIGQALAIGTRDARLLAHAGTIAAAAGDLDRAERHLTEALAINPRFHPFEAAQARALLERLRAPEH